MRLEAILGSKLRAIMTLLLAKSPVIEWLVVGWSKVYTLNKNEASTASWRTPAWMGFILDKAEPERTTKCLYSRYDLNNR
jgi:hypothetical protein